MRHHDIVILTGAGISAESGVPTFRSDDGLWLGHRVEDVATPEAFAHWQVLPSVLVGQGVTPAELGASLPAAREAPATARHVV